MRHAAEIHGRLWERRQVVTSLGVLACLAVAPGCGTVQQTLQDFSAQHPSARVTNVRLADIGVESLQLIFDVTVENPYTFDLPLLDVDYTLVTRERTFLTGSTALDGKVSARHVRAIELPVRVDLASLVNSIESTTPGDVIPYTAELGLRVEVPGAQPLRFPLRKSGDLPIPRAPAVRVVSLDWSETSLNKVEGELRLDVENTNTFAFSVTQLRWDVSLVDVRVASGATRHAVALGPAQVGTLPVELSFSPLDLGTGLVHVLTDLNRESVEYTIAGVMSVETPFGLMELPYAQSGTTRSAPAP